MNKEELKQLIDTEVSKVFSDMTSKEPAKEMEESKDISSEKKIVAPKKRMTEEDFDDVLFYGGQNKKNN
jgi:hypothetical protein